MLSCNAAQCQLLYFFSIGGHVIFTKPTCTFSSTFYFLGSMVRFNYRGRAHFFIYIASTVRFNYSCCASFFIYLAGAVRFNYGGRTAFFIYFASTVCFNYIGCAPFFILPWRSALTIAAAIFSFYRSTSQWRLHTWSEEARILHIKACVRHWLVLHTIQGSHWALSSTALHKHNILFFVSLPITYLPCPTPSHPSHLPTPTTPPRWRPLSAVYWFPIPFFLSFIQSELHRFTQAPASLHTVTCFFLSACPFEWQ